MYFYRHENLIISLLCAILLAGCFPVDEKPPVYDKIPSTKTDWRVYVWGFVSHGEKNNKLTEFLTSDFEQALINTHCCDVLERREYDKLLSHRDIERVISSMENISDTTKEKFKTLMANGVVFGEVYDENDKIKVLVTLQSFNGVKITSENIRISYPDNPLNRELKMEELATLLHLGMLGHDAKPVILFQDIQNMHSDKSMRGVEQRATDLMAHALSHSGLFEIIEDASLQRSDNTELHKKYPDLTYIVSGTLTGDTHITEMTLKFIDARKKTIVKSFRALNVTTSYMDYIVAKLLRELKTAFEDGEVAPSEEKNRIPDSRLLITTFQNKTGDKSLGYIIDNIAEGLITGLSRSYNLVEKSQLDKLYEELRLTSSPMFDFETAVERGKFWMPRYIMLGSFEGNTNAISIDARIVDLETREIKCSEPISGSETELTTLINTLATKFKTCL